MSGLDTEISQLAHGNILLVTLAVAILLGLRHASDPDHLTAVSALLLGGDGHGTRGARRLGAAWGAGHALALITFGVPIVLFRSYLPTPLQQGAEAIVGVVIIALALRLLLRWHRGELRPAASGSRAQRRSQPQAFAIGLIHGTGGSAGVGVLLLASIPDHSQALIALLLFAVCTALSMTGLTGLFGYTLSRGPAPRALALATPWLGAASLSFGAWYILTAVILVL